MTEKGLIFSETSQCAYLKQTVRPSSDPKIRPAGIWKTQLARCRLTAAGDSLPQRHVYSFGKRQHFQIQFAEPKSQEAMERREIGHFLWLKISDLKSESVNRNAKHCQIPILRALELGGQKSNGAQNATKPCNIFWTPKKNVFYRLMKKVAPPPQDRTISIILNHTTPSKTVCY